SSPEPTTSSTQPSRSPGPAPVITADLPSRIPISAVLLVAVPTGRCIQPSVSRRKGCRPQARRAWTTLSHVVYTPRSVMEDERMTEAIDYLVCPFTPDLLERFRGHQPSQDARESSPIKFPDHFMAGNTVPEYVGFMDECGISTSLVASVKFGSITDPHSRLTFDATADEIHAVVEQAPE